MKNIKLVAKILLLVLLLTSAFSFVGCGVPLPHDWEVYSHKEFVKEIEKYNSINDGSVDTFISFDFDSKEYVTKKIYCMTAVANAFMTSKIGLVDILDAHYTIYQAFYLKQEDNSNEYAYKIKCMYSRIDNSFTENNKIEINKYDKHYCTNNDHLYYEERMVGGEPILMYDYYHMYGIYVNDVEIGCIHISSIDETSEEKLDEIIQMLYDSLVVINT